ncbi:hypothetical protein [Saccharopolyspora spinosa]|nr:hypothetical protein [Saccharopolyspora spinosa]
MDPPGIWCAFSVVPCAGSGVRVGDGGRRGLCLRVDGVVAVLTRAD